ncbi:MAG: hypothetical protein ABIB61_00230 [Candidatus Shapirobacteria bacterium]
MKENISINLLPNKSRLQLKQLEIVKKVNLATTVIMGVFLLVVLAVFLLDYYSGRLIRKNNQELENAKSQYFEFSDRISDLQILRFRTKLVAQTLESRYPFGQGIRNLEELVGKQTELSNLAIAKDDLSLRGRFPTLTEFKRFEEKLNNNDYQTALLENLGLEANGQVSFSLKIQWN